MAGGFMEQALKPPVPGAIGMVARLYLDSLDGDGESLSTRYEYWRELTQLCEAYPDRMPEQFSTLDLEAFLMERCQGKSAATRKKVLAILSGFFGYLHDRGGIPLNPTRPIRRPKVNDPEPTFWTGEEVRKLLAVPMPPRDHVLLEVFARTGQRSGPVRNLQWKHIRSVAPRLDLVTCATGTSAPATPASHAQQAPPDQVAAPSHARPARAERNHDPPRQSTVNISALLNRIISNQTVQSVARHFALTFFGALIPVVLAGQPLTWALISAAAAGAARSTWLLVKASVQANAA